MGFFKRPNGYDEPNDLTDTNLRGTKYLKYKIRR